MIDRRTFIGTLVAAAIAPTPTEGYAGILYPKDLLENDQLFVTVIAEPPEKDRLGWVTYRCGETYVIRDGKRYQWGGANPTLAWEYSSEVVFDFQFQS